MVGDPAPIQVRTLEWDDENLSHLALHDVSDADVQGVLEGSPLFFVNAPGRSATHVMIGEDPSGRILYIAIVETSKRGTWRAITGWESRLARDIYRRTAGI